MLSCKILALSTTQESRICISRGCDGGSINVSYLIGFSSRNGKIRTYPAEISGNFLTLEQASFDDILSVSEVEGTSDVLLQKSTSQLKI